VLSVIQRVALCKRHSLWHVMDGFSNFQLLRSVHSMSQLVRG